MANQNIVSSLVAKAMTEFMDNISAVYNTGNNQYEGDFKNSTYATGGNVNIKVPGTPIATTGVATAPQDITDLVVPYTLTPNDIYNITYQYDIQSIDYNILGGDSALTSQQSKAIVDNFGYPAFLEMSRKLEEKAANLFIENSYYSPIDDISKLSSVNNFADVQSVTVMMNMLQLSRQSRTLMMNVNDAASVSNSLVNYFNPALNTKIADEAFVGGSAEKGRLAALDTMQSNSFLPFKAGALGGRTDITVASVASDGLSIVLSVGGTSTDTLIKAGDKFVFPTIKWLQPVGRNVLGYNVTLNAATDAVGDGAGNVTLTLNYPIMASGFHANVSALPAPGAAVQCFPSRNRNFAYTKSGFFVASLPLHNIHGAENSETTIKDRPVKVHVYMQGSVPNGSNIYRISQQTPMKVLSPYVVELPSALT